MCIRDRRIPVGLEDTTSNHVLRLVVLAELFGRQPLAVVLGGPVSDVGVENLILAVRTTVAGLDSDGVIVSAGLLLDDGREELLEGDGHQLPPIIPMSLSTFAPTCITAFWVLPVLLQRGSFLI